MSTTTARNAQLLVMARLAEQDPKDWARRLKEREEAGERLTLAQRDMWRAALGRGVSQDDESCLVNA